MQRMGKSASKLQKPYVYRSLSTFEPAKLPFNFSIKRLKMRISTCNLSFLFVSLLLLCHSFSLESPLFIDWDLQSEWVENHELHRWVSGKEQKHNIFINKESSSWQVFPSRIVVSWLWMWATIKTPLMKFWTYLLCHWHF